MLSLYEKIAPHLNPASGGTVYETRTYSGVRGALRQLSNGGAVYSITCWPYFCINMVHMCLQTYTLLR